MYRNADSVELNFNLERWIESACDSVCVRSWLEQASCTFIQILDLLSCLIFMAESSIWVELQPELCVCVYAQVYVFTGSSFSDFSLGNLP